MSTIGDIKVRFVCPSLEGTSLDVPITLDYKDLEVQMHSAVGRGVLTLDQVDDTKLLLEIAQNSADFPPSLLCDIFDLQEAMRPEDVASLDLSMLSFSSNDLRGISSEDA